VYREFAYFLYEFFSKNPSKVENETDLKSQLELKLGIPGEKSSMILMGHYGNWEIALQKLLEQGYHVTTLSMSHSNPQIDHFFNRLRRHPCLHCHSLETGLKPLLSAIEKKHIIALACERDYRKTGLTLSLFNSHFNFPLGPALIIKRTGLTTYIASQYRLGLLNFNFQLNPLDFSAESSIASISLHIAQQLFEIIKVHPEQWLTFEPYFQADASA